MVVSFLLVNGRVLGVVGGWFWRRRAAGGPIFRAVDPWQTLSAVMAAVLAAVTADGTRPPGILSRLDR